MGPMIGPRAALGLEQGLPPVYIMGQRMILVYMFRMLFVIDLEGLRRSGRPLSLRLWPLAGTNSPIVDIVRDG